MKDIVKLRRRDFLKLGSLAGGGLILGVSLPQQMLEAAEGEAFQPNVFIQIDPENWVTVCVHKSEMGQGIRTALPMIVADELDADWNRIKVTQADAHPDKYGSQMTVGSRSIRGGAWMTLRRAGASAREMLVAAAAARWQVPPDQCRTENSKVIHAPTGREATYGELAKAASQLPLPDEPRLKDPAEFRFIGKSMHQVDTPDRVQGKATFGLDVRVPGMLFATAVHCPVFGGSVESFDASRTREVPGVKEVVQLSQGVAVVAEHTWAALRGAQLLDVTWNHGGFSMSSSDISAHFREVAETEGAVARKEGDVEAALGSAAGRLEAVYEVPYLAHATMEPMNCTAHVLADRCEIWVPTQNPQGVQSTAARLTGLGIDRVTVHVTFLGCGLGRRSRTDFVQDAVEASMKTGAPVQMVWTREEDMQHDFYRPATYTRFQGGLDAEGKLEALKVRVVAPPFGGEGPGGVNRNSVDGVANLPYQIPHLLVDYCRPNVPVPVGYWRSVGPSQNAFVIESFVDELAHAAKRDPFEFRRELLASEPRLRHVLEVAAQRSGWGKPLPEGRARGIGLVINKGGYVAQVAEVSLRDGRPWVEKVTCAADCGRIINPDTAQAQIVGSIAYGLTAVLHGEISIEGGRVRQSNFHDYPLLSIAEMPEVEVVLVESTEEPGGVGEPGVPPIAPAVTNALFALTGTRIRKLPLSNAAFPADAGKAVATAGSH